MQKVEFHIAVALTLFGAGISVSGLQSIKIALICWVSALVLFVIAGWQPLSLLVEQRSAPLVLGLSKLDGSASTLQQNESEKLEQRRPEVIFNFDSTKFNIHGRQEFFSLTNRGTADAFNVKIEDMVNGKHKAVWEIVPTIPQGKSVPATFNFLLDGVLSPVSRDNAGVFLEATWRTTTEMSDHLLRMPLFVAYEDINNNQLKTEFELTYECISKNLEITFKKLHILSRSSRRDIHGPTKISSARQ